MGRLIAASPTRPFALLGRHPSERVLNLDLRSRGLRHTHTFLPRWLGVPVCRGDPTSTAKSPTSTVAIDSTPARHSYGDALSPNSEWPRQLPTTQDACGDPLLHENDGWTCASRHSLSFLYSCFDWCRTQFELLFLSRETWTRPGLWVRVRLRTCFPSKASLNRVYLSANDHMVPSA